MDEGQDGDGFFCAPHAADLKIGVAGLGLIGSSIAMAFHQAGYEVIGFDLNPDAVAAARKAGYVGRADITPEPVFEADVLFLALYPDGIRDFLKKWGARIRKGAVVLDCCGIKRAIFGEAANAARENGFFYLGGHPMAGTERSGYTAARADLFRGASFILTPPETTRKDLIERVSVLLREAGFARVVVTTPEHHDRMIAFTSQLPHVIACAYVASPSCPGHTGFSAGSYRDVSRVAHLNPVMWASLFQENREMLCAEIDHLIGSLQSLRDAVASDDRGRLTALLAQARERKEDADREGS